MISCTGCDRPIDVPMYGEPGAVPKRKIKCKRCGKEMTVLTITPAIPQDRAVPLAGPSPDVTHIYVPFWKGVSDG